MTEKHNSELKQCMFYLSTCSVAATGTLGALGILNVKNKHFESK